MSNEGCPIRGPKGLCQREHSRLVDPKWGRPHHDETAATPCPGEDCERRNGERRILKSHRPTSESRRAPGNRRKPKAGAVTEKAELGEVQPQPEVGAAPGPSAVQQLRGLAEMSGGTTTTKVGTAPAGPSPKRIAEIRQNIESVLQTEPVLSATFRMAADLLAALDAAEADNTRLRAALAPFVKWYALLLLMGWQEETPLGLAPSVSYPLGSRPNIGDLRRAAAAYGPLPKVEP